MAQSHIEQIHFTLFTIEYHGSGSPVYLNCFSRSKHQWNEGFFHGGYFEFSDHAANSRLTTLKPFFLAKPLVNTTGSMPLALVHNLLVLLKTLLDEFKYFTGDH